MALPADVHNALMAYQQAERERQRAEADFQQAQERHKEAEAKREQAVIDVVETMWPASDYPPTQKAHLRLNSATYEVSRTHYGTREIRRLNVIE